MSNKPCIDCPFRKNVGIALPSSRKTEIADVLLHDGYFYCHKTLDYSQGEPKETKSSKFCLGAVIWLDKVDNKFANVCVRLSAMCGHFDPDNLQDIEAVYDSYQDFVSD